MGRRKPSIGCLWKPLVARHHPVNPVGRTQWERPGRWQDPGLGKQTGSSGRRVGVGRSFDEGAVAGGVPRGQYYLLVNWASGKRGPEPQRTQTATMAAFPAVIQVAREPMTQTSTELLFSRLVMTGSLHPGQPRCILVQPRVPQPGARWMCTPHCRAPGVSPCPWWVSGSKQALPPAPSCSPRPPTGLPPLAVRTPALAAPAGTCTCAGQSREWGEAAPCGAALPWARLSNPLPSGRALSPVPAAVSQLSLGVRPR